MSLKHTTLSSALPDAAVYSAQRPQLKQNETAIFCTVVSIVVRSVRGDHSEMLPPTYPVFLGLCRFGIDEGCSCFCFLLEVPGVFF